MHGNLRTLGRHHDKIFDAHTALAGKVKTRFDGDHMAAAQACFFSDKRIFVHIQADAVANTVDELSALLHGSLGCTMHRAKRNAGFHLAQRCLMRGANCAPEVDPFPFDRRLHERPRQVAPITGAHVLGKDVNDDGKTSLQRAGSAIVRFRSRSTATDNCPAANTITFEQGDVDFPSNGFRGQPS